jgi:hypothetical protein
MPNWQPNWNDVIWDWGAANEAIGALQRAASRLDESVHERGLVAAEAQREWRGRYRDEFDVGLADLVRRAQSLAAELRTTASRIASASEAARSEQSYRERERDRWRREKQDEERREREDRERRERERNRR